VIVGTRAVLVMMVGKRCRGDRLASSAILVMHSSGLLSETMVCGTALVLPKDMVCFDISPSSLSTTTRP
jgi:hypothetical protein